MPIYEYECPKCGVFEAVQKVSDKPLKAKPDCDRKDCPRCAERLISQSAFHLKGGGWYKTDYASTRGQLSSNGSPSKESEPAKTESSPPPPAAESTPAPAETKPERKSKKKKR